ncbi:MAG: sulfatase [Planctomycetes bacterium]|nr:sulfatase [Planctomycetota bacterium]MCB9905977.1 sulfatase [Planctomycetota bacterium]
MTRTPLITLFACLALLSGCNDAAKRKPNVLLITLDTLRPDRMGVFGCERDTTPALDAFAAESACFDQAFANSSFTPPSHASILTSRYPSEHGLLHWNKSLGDVPTAADFFGSAGYRTGAFTPFPALLKIGLQRGFEERSVPDPHVTHKLGPDGRPELDQNGQPRIDSYLLAPGEEVNAKALPWLLDESDDRPFFAWVHYYDAHRPYGAHGGKTKYNDFASPEVGDTEKYYRLDEVKREKLGLTSEEVQYIEDRYDGGLARLDEQVGALLDALRAAGRLEDTIVVITGDHGEVFAEYEVDEWFSHDPWLTDENLHVPLFLRLPDGKYAGKHCDELVEGVDVLPTLCELAGVKTGGSQISGRSMLGVLEGVESGKAFVYAERQGDDLTQQAGVDPEVSKRSRDRRRMLRTRELKLVEFVDRGHFELWDLDAETVSIGDQNSAAAANLRRGYINQLERLKRVASGNSALDSELQNSLGALGYIGHSEDE